MATLSKLTPGQILYSVRREKMGNTSTTCGMLHEVRVIEVHADDGYVLASSNGNKPRKYYEHQLKSLKVNKPKPMTTPKTCGNCRHLNEDYDEETNSATEGNCTNPECTHTRVSVGFVCRKHSNVCPGCGQKLGGEATGDTVLGKCLPCANEKAALAVEGVR